MKRTYRANAKQEKLGYARQMRKAPTKAEAIMWEKVRRNKLGYSIRRQAIILGFIVDFYCPQRRLVIELDGPIHESRKEYDRARDAAIGSLGIRIVRFKNSEVLTNLFGVMQEIARLLATYE
jgi:leucyl-tRNA synthetase